MYNSKEPHLTVKELSTHLRVGKRSYPVVDGLSFNLYPGKTLALVGESGCGKSMSALSLMRILPTPPALPSTGEVLYRGQNLLTIPEREMRKIRGRKMAMIFQDPMSALNPVYSVGDQLLEVAKSREQVIKALADVGIPDPAQRCREYPHQLSGGMKQRVMIAMALMYKPDILIADEPTTALDVTVQAQVLDLMRKLQRENEMAILLITHDMGVVAEMADDVIVMYASQAVERADVQTLFDAKAHPYTQGLFASRNMVPIEGKVPSLSEFPKGCHFHPRCPHATEQCQKKPPLINLNPTHEAACWLYEN